MDHRTPTLGRIVIYTLKGTDAEQINKRRADAKRNMEHHRLLSHGVMVHVGNEVTAGDRFPMVITRLWGTTPDSVVQGTVMLDGSDTFWATSVGAGEVAGTWAWPEHV